MDELLDKVFAMTRASRAWIRKNVFPIVNVDSMFQVASVLSQLSIDRGLGILAG